MKKVKLFCKLFGHKKTIQTATLSYSDCSGYHQKSIKVSYCERCESIGV